MGGRGGPALQKGGTSAAPAASQSPLDKIKAAYFESIPPNADLNSGEFVMLPAIRDGLAERGITDRVSQDAAIREFALQPDGRVIPIANLKSLSDADRNAAIQLGGELKHAIAWVGRRS